MLTKQDAKKIVTKLGAATREGGKHTWAYFELDGKRYKFAIRRGPKSNHAHLVNDLHLSMRRVQNLADCNMSKSDYFEVLRQR